jgi:hypothetical protein
MFSEDLETSGSTVEERCFQRRVTPSKVIRASAPAEKSSRPTVPCDGAENEPVGRRWEPAETL